MEYLGTTGGELSELSEVLCTIGGMFGCGILLGIIGGGLFFGGIVGVLGTVSLSNCLNKINIKFRILSIKISKT